MLEEPPFVAVVPPEFPPLVVWVDPPLLLEEPNSVRLVSLFEDVMVETVVVGVNVGGAVPVPEGGIVEFFMGKGALVVGTVGRALDGALVIGADVPVPEGIVGGIVELFMGKGALVLGIVGSPLDGALVKGTDVPGRMPVGRMRVGRVPVGRMLVGRVPVGRMLVGRVPVGRMLVGRVPVGSTPVGRVPVGRVPVGEKGGMMPLGSSCLLSNSLWPL